MKKTIIILTIIVSATFVFVVSCSKDKSARNDYNKSAKLTPYEMQVGKIIKDFKSKMAYYRDNPNLKSGDNISVDSAIWLLESTFNYSHSFPAETYFEMEIDTINHVIRKAVQILLI